MDDYTTSTTRESSTGREIKPEKFIRLKG